MLNLVQGYLSMPFPIEILNYFKNGFKLWKEKTGCQTNTALSVVTTLNHPVLLSDQEKLGADCMTIQFQQFSLPTKRAEKEKTANGKGVCFTTKVLWTFTIKSCKVSWKWTLICQHHRQCTLLRWNSWKRHWKFCSKKFDDKRKKLKKMEELMKSLKDKQLVASQQHNFLDHNFGGVSKCLSENQMENSQLKDKNSYPYNLETKQFAMTLHY